MPHCSANTIHSCFKKNELKPHLRKVCRAEASVRRALRECWVIPPVIGCGFRSRDGRRALSLPAPQRSAISGGMHGRTTRAALSWKPACHCHQNQENQHAMTMICDRCGHRQHLHVLRTIGRQTQRLGQRTPYHNRLGAYNPCTCLTSTILMPKKLSWFLII